MESAPDAKRSEESNIAFAKQRAAGMWHRSVICSQWNDRHPFINIRYWANMQPECIIHILIMHRTHSVIKSRSHRSSALFAVLPHLILAREIFPLSAQLLHCISEFFKSDLYGECIWAVDEFNSPRGNRRRTHACSFGVLLGKQKEAGGDLMSSTF